MIQTSLPDIECEESYPLLNAADRRLVQGEIRLLAKPVLRMLSLYAGLAVCIVLSVWISISLDWARWENHQITGAVYMTLAVLFFILAAKKAHALWLLFKIKNKSRKYSLTAHLFLNTDSNDRCVFHLNGELIHLRAPQAAELSYIRELFDRLSSGDMVRIEATQKHDGIIFSAKPINHIH